MGLLSSKRKKFKEEDIAILLSFHNNKLIWTRKFGDKVTQLCPLCRIYTMNKRKNNWSVAHIRYYDGYTNKNMVPVCHKCSLKYKNRIKTNNIDLVDISRGNHDKNIIY